MKKIMILTVVFALLTVSAFAVPSYPQTIGIAVDDWFVYEGIFTIDPSTASVPFQLQAYQVWEGYDSLNRTVVAIDGTNITFEDVYTLTAGGTTTATTVLNISAPTTNQYWAIDADAVVDTQIGWGDLWLNYTDPTTAGTVNITDNFTWGFESDRECVIHESTTAAGATIDRAFWWDDATGILVQAWFKAVSTDGSFVEHKITLTETNRWDIPEFPTGTAMLLVFVSVAVSINIYRRKKLN